MAGALATAVPCTCAALSTVAQRVSVGFHSSSVQQQRGHRHGKLPQRRRCCRLPPAAAAIGGPAPAEEEEQLQPGGLQFQRGNCYGCGTRLQIAEPEVGDALRAPLQGPPASAPLNLPCRGTMHAHTQCMQHPPQDAVGGCAERLVAVLCAVQVAGYVEPERYDTKLRRRQLHQLLCLR